MHFKTKLLLGWVLIHQLVYSQQLPEGFTNLVRVIPTLEVELRYATSNNFMGRSVAGYHSDSAIGSIAMAKQLKKVQEALKPLGLGLKIYDAYRPQTAVNDFIRWSKLPQDTLAKQKYYPNHLKNKLFDLGFIASKSGHSRGSTVDLTLVYLEGENKKTVLDMGSPWDFFGTISHYSSTEISDQQKANRKLLRELMLSNGFKPYDKEWWHFTLDKEPYPDTYFDFLISTP
jgi:D-alanyl-D-alanine dipeptidase